VPIIGAKSALLLTASLVSSLNMLDSNIVDVPLAASFTDIQREINRPKMLKRAMYGGAGVEL
jgi:hypothetical protein